MSYSPIAVYYTSTVSYSYTDSVATTPTAISISYMDAGDPSTSGSEQVLMTAPKVDLTDGFAEQIALGSVRFTLGGRTYVDRLGALVHSVQADTGVATNAGTIDYTTGQVTITDWPNASSVVELQSLVTQMPYEPVSYMVFRTPIAPVRPASLQVLATAADGDTLDFTIPSNGVVNLPNVRGTVDYRFGLVALEFGSVVEITEANRAGIEAEPWYDAGVVETTGGKDYIFKPKWVIPSSVRFNGVGYSYLPLSADILGLDPVRLPSDGRVPIFRPAEVIIVSATEREQVLNTEPLAQASVAETRLIMLRLVDSEGVLVDTETYSVDLANGSYELDLDFTTTGYALPLFAEYVYQDMVLATDVQISGQITLSRTLSHSYEPANSVVSSALILGDLQARYHTVFSQQAWDNVYQSTREGSPIAPQYNSAVYPIQVTNKGSIKERWALVFLTNNQFRILGQSVGQIGMGDVNSTCSPVNPVTGLPYFTIQPEGWGGGWVSGNTLRFDTEAANRPVWVARTVLQGTETAEEDSFTLEVRGNIDRP